MAQSAFPQAWLARLQSSDPARLQQALREWPHDPRASSPAAAAVWRQVEQLALRASDAQVQQAALQALTSPAARRFYHGRTAWSPGLRAALRAEIAGWAREGLISPAQAAVLQARYADPPRTEARAPAPTAAARRASPWALHVVLYLGAFFVIAAALLFAALVEAWRLPILLLATALFGAAAAGVYRITPTGGRVLGIVAAGFLWADAAVLSDLFAPYWGPDGQDLYWAAATFVLAVVWLLAGWLLRSGVLTLAAWPMAAASVAFAWAWLDPYFPLARALRLHVTWTAEVLAAAAWAAWSRARLSRAARWLWAVSHGVALLLLLTALPILAFEVLDAPAEHRPTMAGLALLGHLLLLGFYAVARRGLGPAPWIESWAVPWAVLGAMLAWTLLWPTGWPQAVALALAALACAALAEGVRRIGLGMPRAWGLGLELVAGLGWWVAGVLLVEDSSVAWRHVGALVVWLAGALWGWSMGWRAARWVPTLWGWLLSQTAFAHFIARVWPGQADVYWPGWWLLSVLGSAALDAWARRAQRRVVMYVARGGLVVTAWGLGVQILGRWGEFALRDAGVVLALTVLLAAYARALRKAWLWAGVPVMAWASWGLVLSALGADHPATLAAWPVVAALVVWGVARSRPSPPWRAWGWGTLVSAWLTALTALFTDDGWSALALAMMATVTGGFAWLWHPLALAVPTAGLYFAAYAWTLHLWHVRQPQGYTVPAAVLGLLLHALYRRRGHRVIAFVLGAVAQLVLFTTTYIQMVDQRSGWYFAVLFLQALVVLGYGLWSNDPALIWTPVGFVVLATVTLVLIRFQGLGVLALLCGAGLALLAGGLFFLWRRARREASAEPPASPARPDSASTESSTH